MAIWSYFSPSVEFDIIFVGGYWAMWQHSERYEISQRLWHELDKARLEHAAAAERFNLLVKNPGGIPATRWIPRHSASRRSVQIAPYSTI